MTFHLIRGRSQKTSKCSKDQIQTMMTQAQHVEEEYFNLSKLETTFNDVTVKKVICGIGKLLLNVKAMVECNSLQTTGQIQVVEGYLHASGIMAQTTDEDGHSHRSFNIHSHTQRLTNIESLIEDQTSTNLEVENRLKEVTDYFEKSTIQIAELKYQMREISYIKDKMDGSLEELASHSIALKNFKKEYRDSKPADNKTFQELKLQLSTAGFKARADI